MTPLLSIREVAASLNVSDDHVRRLIATVKLQAVRVGWRWRIEPEALDAFVAAQRTGAASTPPQRSELPRLEHNPFA